VAEGRTHVRLVLIALVIGVPAALVAAGFLAGVGAVEDWLWPSEPAWYLVLFLPMVGAAVVAAARSLLPGDGGHSPLKGFGGGATPLAHAPGIALAALGTLAFGAVLGPEGPLIALGSVVGVAVARLVRAEGRTREVLATAGSFSAISALFGGPLVAGMLLVESGIALGSALIPALLPGLVAAAAGYVLFVGLGDWGGIDAAGLAVPGLPAYTGTHVLDLVLAVLVGIAAALSIALVRRGAVRIEALREQGVGMVVLLLAGGAAVGVLALLVRAAGAPAQDELFSGQAAVPDLVAEGSLKLVLVLLVAKALGYAICLGCGFRGGPVFPAIFLAVALAMIAVVTFDRSPTWAIAVGAAAGMAAGTRLLFSPVLFGALLVGDQGTDAIPAAVFAAAAAWITIHALEHATTGAPAEDPR
jgi:H+/Cl- antiporter ClcA